MGEFLVRASREPDSPYLLWSTIVDAPTYVFATGDEVLEHLRADDERKHSGYVPVGSSRPEARLARADKHGTSAIDPQGAFGWDDDEFVVMNGVPDQPKGVWWGLPRARLTDYARAYLNDDEPAAMALLVSHPFEDDEPGDTTGGGS